MLKRFPFVLLVLCLSLTGALSKDSQAQAYRSEEVLSAVRERAGGEYLSACFEVYGDEQDLETYQRRISELPSLPSETISSVETSEGAFAVSSGQLFVAALRDEECIYVHFALEVAPGGDRQLLWGFSEGWTPSPVGGELVHYPGGVSAAVVLLEDGTAVAVQYVAGEPVAYSVPSVDYGRWHALP